MTQLTDAYSKADIVTRYQEAMSVAQITVNDRDSYVIQTEYKGNLISISFRKDKFMWYWKVVILEPKYRKIADHIIPYLDELVFADKICHLFTETFPLLKGGSWCEKNSFHSLDSNSSGFINRSECARYLGLDCGNVTGRYLRVLC